MGLRLLALACLVGAALAGPLPLSSQSRCAKQCSRPSSSKFDYEIGKTYTYEYQGENVVSATGKPRQVATIEGLAVIHVVDRCEMVLQLRNLRIQQKLSPEEIEQLTEKLELPMPFSFDDGAVEQVCPSSEEDMQSLNIKKGLISSFINTMSKLDTPQELREFDSLGHCLTQYSVKYDQGLEIRKSKSLKSCTNRHTSITSMITNPYDSPDSKLHTLPIFPDEQLECVQSIEDKIIKSIQCEEHAKVQPLSQKSSVIQFEGQVHLSLLSISSDESLRQWASNWPQNSQPSPSRSSQDPGEMWPRRESIKFALEEAKDVKSQERETEQLLREMCSKNDPTIDTSVSKDFIQLVSLVKSLPYSSLSSIHSSLKSGRLCSSKKVHDLFVDTLPMTGSDAAIKHMVKLLANKEITGLKAKLWPVSLALIPKPTREAVAEIAPLLKMQSSDDDSSSPSTITLLGVSAMVHRFCGSRKCENEKSVQEITSILSQQIGSGCSSDNDSQTLAALKAFGNMGHHGDAERSILACAQNKDKPTRLRLAAIDAFRRMNQKRPEKLIQIFSDSEDLPEIRIAAFSSLMKQADAQQLRSIKRIVEQESDEQVSAYVSSFLKNMKTTSSPLKKSVKQALEQVEINPPKVSYWQNSKNIEFSTFSETFNIGGSVETDIVHSTHSKIPKSVTTRFDADVLNNNMNIFEIGVRAEGFDAIFKNLLGLKEKMPKTSSPWNLLTSESVFGGVDAEASAFIRTMNTEILDLSASDLSGVGEMMKIADLMNKLAQGKSSDFSQSFLFLNSKVIIPSVTGRSYSFGVTGSATVGLTAATRLDVMRFPRNTDAHARFQPSLNVELSTTVGIQSSQHRPDLKLSTRMHLESNMEAQFKTKDGHYAIASVSLPTENVVRARVSSDIVEVDSHQQEKPVFEKMQKKIDYCFDKLQKPLGVSICGMFEVPKPFVTQSFPFVNAGVGSMEFAIKKTDRTLKSFELKLERPRHSSSTQKFTASFDTPGSQVNRRFAAELEVRRQGQSSQEYSLELTSPFKNTGGKGSFTQREDLLEGSLEIHTDSSPWLTFNASSQISSSRSKKVYKPSIQLIMRNRSPLQVSGLVSVTEGRKQVVSLDIKANKPSRRPMSMRGSISKEGSFELSKKSEWKVSSDLSFECMLGEAQVRSMLEKQSKQAQTVSASFETDYKKDSQKQSMSLSGTIQQSSSKISTNAQFQSSQFPSTSWSLKWERQGKPQQSLKNDVTLRYGRQPERNYISFKQSSSMPSNGPRQCKVSLKAPQLNIDSELSIAHEISSSKGTQQLQIDGDMSYKSDKLIKGSLSFDHSSVKPFKASSKLQLELPCGKLSYSDEIEETSTNKFEGNTRMQWKDSRPAQLKYIYQILSDKSKFHHEITTSLQLPSSRSPIQSKCSLKLRGQTAWIEGSLSSRRPSEYSIQAQLSPWGSSSVRLQTPMADGDLKVQNEQQKKAFDLDLRVKGSKSRRVIASTKAQLGSKKSFEVEMSWDSDRQPEKKISFTSKGEISSSSYSSSSQLQIRDLLSVSLNESGQKPFLGNHEGSLEASIKNRQPIRLDYSHSLSNGQSKCQLKYSQNNVEKFEAKLEGKAIKSSNGRDLGLKASLSSLDNSFQSKEIKLSHSSQKSGSSGEMVTLISIQRSPSKVYKAELSSETQPRKFQVKAKINTPHSKFSQQSVAMSVQTSESSISSLVSLELPENKIFSISSEMQKRSQEKSATVVMKSPFESLKDIKAHISVQNRRSQKSLLSFVDVNRARWADIEATMSKSSTEKSLQCQLKVSPTPKMKFQGMSMSFKQSTSSLELSGDIQMQGEKRVSVSSQISKPRSGLSASFSLNTPFKKLQSVNASFVQSRSSAKLSGSARYMGDKEISVSSQFVKERSKLSATTTLSTPYQLKEAKAHISIESESSLKSLLAFVDANGQRKGDIEMTYSSSPSGMELQSRMKTVRSQEVSAHAKLERSSNSASFEVKMHKGSPVLLSSSRRRLSQGSEQTLFEWRISRQSSRNSNSYSMKLSGPVSPVTLNMSSTRIEGDGLRLEASACQESQQKQCYKLKTGEKTLKNSEGYRHYRQLTVDVEKTTDSRREPVCTTSLIWSSAANDYKSKLTVEFKGKTVGYEVRAHRRLHEDDHCSIDAHIFMPRQTARFMTSVLHSPSRLSWEIAATPDASVPQKKYSIEMTSSLNENKSELSGVVSMSCPKIEQPAQMVFQIKREGWIPVQGKCELAYPSLKQSSRSQPKKLTLEMSTHLQQRSSGKKFISYKLYNADRSLRMSLEMKKESSRQQNSYGYEWSYQKQSSHSKGGVSIKLSRKQNGRPHALEVSLYTPNIAFELQGRRSSSPQDGSFSLSLLSGGEKVREVTISTSDSCIEMRVRESAPVMKSSFCINKRVGDSMQLVALDVWCPSQKCLSSSVGIDSKTSPFITLKMQWDKEALIETSGLKQLLKDLSWDELEQELKEIVRHLKDDVIMPALSKWKQSLQQQKEQRTQQIKNMIEQHQQMLQAHAEKWQQYKQTVSDWANTYMPWDYIYKQILLPLTQVAKCVADSYFQIALKYLPEISNIIIQATREQLAYCLKKFCVEGTFCHDIRLMYERQGMEQAKQLAIQKMWKKKDLYQKQISQKLSEWDKIIHQNIPAVAQVLFETIDSYAHKVGRIMSEIMQSETYQKLSEYAKVYGEKALSYGSKCCEKVFEKMSFMLNEIRKDEDFQTVRSMTRFLTQSTEEQVQSLWENRSSYLRQMKSIMVKAWEYKDELFRKVSSQLKSLWENREEYVRQLQRAWGNKGKYARKAQSTWENKNEHLRSLQNAWENRENIVKQELMPLTQKMMNKSKELMKGRLEVPEFDLHQGNIKVLVRNPLEPRHIQVVQNILRACKQKIQQTLSS